MANAFRLCFNERLYLSFYCFNCYSNIYVFMLFYKGLLIKPVNNSFKKIVVVKNVHSIHKE